MGNRVDVHNVVSGAAGSVVQAGTIHQVVLPLSPETPPIPQQLPPPVRGFTGRIEQLAALDALLPAPAPAPERW
ncbi:hypothetical protein M8C13_07570 [Crossiella sp. SN42]|uniref:hypothetical protein n=1 Tax=Crossiella sp. SN42 TaxID=2944808 RepID=UPI00207C5B5D|nr:hypothetical protein [Crossiella sp. SN42]MCO1575616.1 hypothetical protein [Crossiella sp. SN42]